MYPTPWIDPSSTVHYYIMSVWHVQECRHMQVTYTTPSMNLSGRKPQYIMSLWHIEPCRHTHIRCIPPMNGTHCYRALLHSISFICRRVQMYPGHVDPTPHTTLLTTKAISCRRGILCDVMFLFLMQICMKCKNHLHTGVLVVSSLYCLWRFTYVKHAYKHYSHLITFLS